MSIFEAIAADIADATGLRARCEPLRSVAGGCINRAMRVRYGNITYFVKLNTAGHLDMFAAEAAGLQALRGAHDLHIPEPVCWNENRQSSWLVMEHLDLGGRPRPRALGKGLAAMHRITQPEYGWHRDNTIGSTPQSNLPTDNWIDFWRRRRLQVQLELAAGNGAMGALQERGALLLENLPALLENHQPQSSVLHGDLWSGNHAYTIAGRATIFDPAMYYGDRETDLAMTELFGGFGHEFYAAYNDTWPLDSGYQVRKILYNLYHVLNHFNLFGGGYARQALEMINSLLSELR